MTFGDFKKTHNGGYMKCAADDIAGFARKGGSLYGNCDDMVVANYQYQPLNGVYTVYLKNS